MVVSSFVLIEIRELENVSIADSSMHLFVDQSLCNFMYMFHFSAPSSTFTVLGDSPAYESIPARQNGLLKAGNL